MTYMTKIQQLCNVLAYCKNKAADVRNISGINLII